MTNIKYKTTHLKGDGEESDGDISEGQVGDVPVGHILHSFGGQYYPHDQHVTCHGHHWDWAVQEW